MAQPARDELVSPYSPLPLGEGQGVRAKTAGNPSIRSHANLLPWREGSPRPQRHRDGTGIGFGVIMGAVVDMHEEPHGLPQGLQHESDTTHGSLTTTDCWGCGPKREFHAYRQHSPMRQPLVPQNKSPNTVKTSSLFMIGLLHIRAQTPAPRATNQVSAWVRQRTGRMDCTVDMGRDR
jgi:hypothetical protein